MKFDDLLQERHSVRKFKNKSPDWRDIIECIDSMRYSPMAGNIYTLKFILVSEPEKIQKLAEAAQQPFIAQTKYIVVVCSNKNRTSSTYEEKGDAYVRQQAGAAIQNFLLKITEKGLATCWIGAFVENMVQEILDIPKGIQVEAMFPIGYEFQKPMTKKIKIELDNILYFEKYNNKKMNKIIKVDA